MKIRALPTMTIGNQWQWGNKMKDDRYYGDGSNCHENCDGDCDNCEVMISSFLDETDLNDDIDAENQRG